MSNNEPYILLFDGVCNLCNSLVQFVIKRDTKGIFKFAPLQSDIGQALLKKLDLPTDDLSSFILIHDDKYFLKSSAGLHVLKVLGGFWKMCYVFIIFPPPWRDFIYDIIAKTRYRIFGKRNACMIPTPDIAQRFL